MVVADAWVILEGFGKIDAFCFAKIGRPKFPLGREVRNIILSSVAYIGAVGFGILEPFGLGELYFLVLAFEVSVAVL
jgi:hypothetical protein